VHVDRRSEFALEAFEKLAGYNPSRSLVVFYATRCAPVEGKPGNEREAIPEAGDNAIAVLTAARNRA
jgi:hypothetical protein